MAQVAAICNQKGGVGKTTLTINLGAALSQMGAKVLLVDLDPQGHLTEGIGLSDEYLQSPATLYNALVGKKPTDPTSLVRKSPHEALWVIPASYELMLAEQALYMARNREHKLRSLLTNLEDDFDWILIDCPPVLGNLTDNALNAARRVIVPIQAEATSVRAVELLFDQIESIERGLSIQIDVLAVVPNLVQDSALSRKILEQLREVVPVVTPFEMRKRVMLQSAWAAGRSIFAYDTPSSADERTRREIADLYVRLAEFVASKTKEPARV